MPSKWDLIRSGQAVEIEPGVRGRLNKEKKTLELSSGKSLNVADNPNFFPRDTAELNQSKQREYLERGTNTPAGQFLHQYTSQGIPGGVGDIISYITQSGEDYANRKSASQKISQRISKESPYISGAATAANIGTDIALTGGMSAARAAPLLTAGSAGSRLFTEPENVAAEALGASVLGKGLDLTGNYFNRIAQRRAQSRALPTQQQNVRNSNIAGQQAVDQLNAAQNQQFNALSQNIKNTNEMRLKQYQDDLATRQNNMIQASNNYQQRKAANEVQIAQLKNQREIAKAQRSADQNKLTAEYEAKLAATKQEEKRLQDEFKLAQKQYEEAVRDFPRLQKKAQEEFSSNIVRNAKEIEKSFPKNSKISTEELGIENFIDDNIQKSGLAGSSEANRANRTLRAIFPEGELLGGRELASRYKALEDAIQRATPEVQQVLNNFKNHLGEKLPSILEDSIAFSKIMPLIKRTVNADIKSILNGLDLGKDAARLNKLASSKANQMLNGGMLSRNFVTKSETGELARNIANKILTPEDFLIELTPSNIKFMQKQGTLPILQQEAKRKHDLFVGEMVKKLDAKISRYEIKAMQSARDARKKMGKEVKKTYGMANEVSPPNPPSPPSPLAIPERPSELPPIPPIQIPPPITPPQTPAMPNKPSLLPMPTAPTPQTFVPQVEPSLPPAGTSSDKLGDMLEKNLLGGKTLANNPLTKLAGLKYLLGKAALPAEAGYLGLQALTSPTAMGNAVRVSFKQGGIQAIESWAQRYPSYQNGILQSPQDRRSLTKEIEDDPSIPLEQKAVLQSKVNRGKPIQSAL